MPIYTFRCPNCEIDEEVILPINRRNVTRFHLCGCEMERLISLPLPAIFKPTARGMALDTLNGGHATPDRWYKSRAEKLAAAGLEEPPKTIF